ncbi:MAG: peroxidase family protein [Pirellulales bacterium]
MLISIRRDGDADHPADLRSIYDATTGTSSSNPRQQVNAITAFVDASQVYGSDAQRAAALRTLQGGHLKTSWRGLLLFNTTGLRIRLRPVHGSAFYVAGDVRANENVELPGVAYAVRAGTQSGRRSTGKPAILPGPTRTVPEARRVVAAELQVITYNEFLPALLGANALRPYQGYKAQVNLELPTNSPPPPLVSGNSPLGDDIEFLNNQGQEVHDPVSLRDAFFQCPALGRTESIRSSSISPR